VQVARLSDEQAQATFRALRWHETGGDPVCPAGDCVACYEYHTRHLFKCKNCGKQLSMLEEISAKRLDENSPLGQAD
jgi:transposase-like protein